MKWEVFTDVYEEIEPVLDDGSGPLVPVQDWVMVEAPDWNAAMALGREMLETEFGHRGWIGQRRSDGVYPFTGVHCQQLPTECPDCLAGPDEPHGADCHKAAS